MSPSAPTPGSRLVAHLAYEVVVLCVTAVAAAVLGFVAFGGRFADAWVATRGSAPVSGEVALMAIDDEALYLWSADTPRPERTPRPLLAEVIRFLDAAGARVVVLDLVLDTPDRADPTLAARVAEHGAVVFAADVVRQGEAAFAAGPPPGLGADLFTGAANLHLEEATLFGGELLVRGAPLVWRSAWARTQGRYPSTLVGGDLSSDGLVPSLGLAAAWLQRRRGAGEAPTPSDLAAELEAACPEPTAPCAGLATLGLAPGPLAVGAVRPVNFRGPEWVDGIPVVSAATALRATGLEALSVQLGADLPLQVPSAAAAVLRDRVVVVGRTDQGAGATDRFSTPYGWPLHRSPDMAGARIHAHIIDTLLTGRRIRTVPAWIEWLVGAALGVAAAAARRWMRGPAHLAAVLSACLLACGASALLFKLTDGLVFEPGPVVGLGLLATVGVHLAAWVRLEGGT